MMKRSLSVFLVLLLCFFCLNLSAPAAFACGDEEPGGGGGLKLQGYSFIEDPELAEALAQPIADCSCAEVLTVLMEYDFEIMDVSGIQGPPGVVYTLVRGRPARAKDLPVDPPPPGVAVVKCGKAGSCVGDTGGCETPDGGTGGCETPH